MKGCILFLSFLLLAFPTGAALAGQPGFPLSEGGKARYAIMIDFGKGYISGVCALARENDKVLGAVFNEFGVSVISFSYHARTHRTKVLHTAGHLRRRYMKRALKHDIGALMDALTPSGAIYRNERFRISYSLSPFTASL